MNLEKLYKALVVGGAALTIGGCASTGASVEAERRVNPTDCNSVCTNSGMAMFCPDPHQAKKNIKQMNCCWLMPHPRHACCD